MKIPEPFTLAGLASDKGYMRAVFWSVKDRRHFIEVGTNKQDHGYVLIGKYGTEGGPDPLSMMNILSGKFDKIVTFEITVAEAKEIIDGVE